MKINKLFFLACVGIFVGLISVYIYNEKIKPEPPLNVSYNPYKKGIYATGIVESYQPSGSNVNIYAEVSGKVMAVFVKDGEVLKKGAPLLAIDDSVQKEIVAKDTAQVKYTLATLLNLQDQLEKIQKSYTLDPKSVSKNTLDSAINAVKIQKESVSVAKAQYKSDKALLDKYIITSPIDGMMLRVDIGVGDYVSPLGRYDTYTQAMLPVLEMGIVTPYLEVRCFLDEILVPSLPNPTNLEATLFVRGENNKSVVLEFVRIQPYTIPKIELSNQRLERVDVRVLPILFRFKKPMNINIYPGQLVDVYIKGKR
jgi:HlyD family secretion protein